MKRSKKQKKSMLFNILRIIVVIFILFICMVVAILLTQKPKDLNITNVDISTIRDGIYTGDADNGLIKVRVSVTVDKGIIQNIEIINHDCLLGKPAESIIDDIMEKQSLQVDTITSATYSSDTIRKAVETALRKGEQE